MNIFLIFQGQTVILSENEMMSLLEQAKQQQGFRFVSQGRNCSTATKFYNHQTVYVLGRLAGGKGGFGAKLKTEGGKKVRPNENMFSRDLQGQPVAYSTINRQYEQFYRRRTLENQKVQKQLAQFQVVSNTYKEEYVSSKLDSTYNVQIQQNQRRLKEGLRMGMKKYLQKKNGAQINGDSQKANQKQNNDQDSEQDKNKQDIVQDQLEGVKRDKPIGKVDQDEKLPDKRVKPNETGQDDEKKQKKAPTQNERLLSAKQKLKSLFKKG